MKPVLFVTMATICIGLLVGFSLTLVSAVLAYRSEFVDYPTGQAIYDAVCDAHDHSDNARLLRLVYPVVQSIGMASPCED